MDLLDDTDAVLDAARPGRLRPHDLMGVLVRAVLLVCFFDLPGLVADGELALLPTVAPSGVIVSK